MHIFHVASCFRKEHVDYWGYAKYNQPALWQKGKRTWDTHCECGVTSSGDPGGSGLDP